MKTLSKRLTAAAAALLTTALTALAQTTAPFWQLSQMESVGSAPYPVQLDAQTDSVDSYHIDPGQYVKNYVLSQLGTVNLYEVQYMALSGPDVLTDTMTIDNGYWFGSNGYVCWPDGQTERMAVQCDRDSMNLALTQRPGAYRQGDRDTLRIYAVYNQKYFEFQLNISFTDYNEMAYQELKKQLNTLNKQTDKTDALLPPLRNRHAEVRNTLDNTQAQAAQYGTLYDDILTEYRFEVDTIGVEINNIQLRRYDEAINEAYQAGVLDQQKDSLSEEMTFYQETILPIINDQITSLTDRLNSLEASIQDLNASMTAYDQEVADLQSRLTQLNQQTDQVAAGIAPLNEAWEDAQAQLTQVNARAKNYGNAFTPSVEASQAELQAIRLGIDSLQLRRFDDEVNQAIANHTVLEEKDSLVARMDDYAANGLPAASQQMDALSQRIAAVAGNTADISAAIDAYDISAQELIQLNTQINQQNDSVQALYQAMQVNYNTVEARYNTVKADAAPYGDQFADQLDKIESRLTQCNTNATLLGDMFRHFDDPVNTAVSEHTVLSSDSLQTAMLTYKDETLPWMAGMIADNNLGLSYATQDIDTLSQSIYGAAYAELTAKQAELDAATTLADTLRAALIARYDATNEWHEEVSNAAAEYNGRYDQQLAASRAALDSIKVEIDSLPQLRYFGPEIEAANQAGQAEMRKDSLMMDMDNYLNVTLPAITQQMEQLSASLTPLELEFDAMETTINAYYAIYDELIAEAQELNEKTETLQDELLPPLAGRLVETDSLMLQAQAEAQQYAPAYDDAIAAFQQRRDSIDTAMQTLPFTDFTAAVTAADSTRSADLISDSLKAAMLSYETDTLRAIRQQVALMNQQIDQLQADIRQLQADIQEQQFAQLHTLQQAVGEETARQQALIDTLKTRNADMSLHILELQNHVEPYGHKFDGGIAESNARVAAISQALLGIGYTDYNAIIAAAERDGQLAQKKDSLVMQMDEYSQTTLPANDESIKLLETDITAAEAFIDSIENAVNNVWVTPVNGMATVADPMGGLRNILQQHDEVRNLTILGQMMDDDFSALSAMTALEQLALPEVNTNTDTLLLGTLKHLLTVTTTGQQSVLKDYVFEGCNPNLIVYAPAGATVENSHCIAVIDGQAGVINLTDARSIRITQPFHAMQVSYTRNFTKRTYVGESAGWETITLPFDVQQVNTADGRTIQTFGTGDDDTPHYWLAQIGDENFTAATEIKANVPYIIAMPNSLQYHDYMNVAGNVTFTATDTEVQSTTALTAYEGAYIFAPLYEANGETDVYTVNDQAYLSYQPGAVFVRNLRAARPFEGYVTLKSGARQRDYLPIWADDATGIASLKAETPAEADTPVYDLSGRRINTPVRGINIVGGKKVLVK